jgi:ClpP class serine protease
MKAFDLAASVPWAIRPESLQQILAIAARAHEPNFEAVTARLLERERELDPTSVAAVQGDRLDGTRYTRVRGETAILPIEGPIFRYANLMTMLSGATSVEVLAKDLQVALDSPDIGSILLHVDSPGGQVNGVAEFADMLYAARGKKPIMAYISHEGCSAAYWIASAADRIEVAQTAMVGCIGAVLAIPDPKQDDSGRVEFVSANAPNKRPDPGTRQGRAEIEGIVDTLGDQFVQAVARNRGVSVDTVLADFGQGGILIGQAAVDAGLADGVGSFEAMLAELQPADDPAESSRASDGARIAKPAEPATRAVKPTPQRRTKTMGFREKWDAFVASFDGDSEDMPPTVAARPTSPTMPPADSPEVTALRERTERLEAENARIMQERINDQAIAFADGQVREGRAFPAERESLIRQYVQAATDDRLHGAITAGTADGQTSTTRVAILTETLAARPAHGLTHEAVRSVDGQQVLANRITTPNAGDAPPSREELDRLLAMTPGGRVTLAARTNGRGN